MEELQDPQEVVEEPQEVEELCVGLSEMTLRELEEAIEVPVGVLQALSAQEEFREVVQQMIRYVAEKAQYESTLKEFSEVLNERNQELESKHAEIAALQLELERERSVRSELEEVTREFERRLRELQNKHEEATMKPHLKRKQHHSAMRRRKGKYLCKLCNIHVSGEGSLQAHFRGKLHQSVSRNATARLVDISNTNTCQEESMAVVSLMQESVWLDRHKFEEAEARYQQILAQRLAGLRVEGGHNLDDRVSQREDRDLKQEAAKKPHLMRKQHHSAMRRRKGKYLCELCKIHVSGEGSLQAHFRGKLHQSVSRNATARLVDISNTNTCQEESMAVVTLMQESIWLDQHKFEEAEARYQQILAQRLAGLRVEGGRNLDDRVSQREGRDLKQEAAMKPHLKRKRKLHESAKRHQENKHLCELCNIHVSGEGSLQAHFRGKLHQSVSKNATLARREQKSTLSRKSKVAATGNVHFPPGTIEETELAHTMEEEIEVLCDHYRMPDAAIEKQFYLCQLLQSALRKAFPDCMVVPFGASISGFATLTSDCDVCLLTDPTEEDRKLLTGREYYSEKHLAMWETVATANDDSPKISPITFKTYSKKNPKYTIEYDIALSVIRKLPSRSIQPIAFARCPIINFLHSPTGIHCDLSINNRLGPYNTRLMRAYCEFDSRIVQLVIFLRMWARRIGLNRAHINNYALSQLLIYALQRASIPVLPCLQDPGSWPKNMEWFAVHECAGAVSSTAPVVAGGWRCDFTPPASLSSSSNYSSVVELLLHFFHFYSEQFEFGKEVVAIHCNSSRKLNVQLAINLMKKGVQVSKPKSLAFRTSPLCVQDPFELSHNVTKTLTKKSFTSLKQLLRSSCLILREQLQLQQERTHPSSLFLLFGNKHTRDSTCKKTSTHISNFRILVFPPNKISCLFKKVDAFRPLADRLHELDLSNAEVTRTLSLGILKALVAILGQDLGFSCLPGSISSSEHMLLVPTQSQPCGSSDGSKQSVDVTPQELSAEELCEATVPQGEEEKTTVVSEETDKTSHEQQRTLQEEKVGETSKSKNSTMIPALDILRSALGEERWLSDAYICTAYSKMWVHRRADRKPKRLESTSMRSLGRSLPEVAPLLQFSLSVTTELSQIQLRDFTVPDNMVAAVKLAECNPLYASEFSNFFGFFKKLVILKQKT